MNEELETDLVMCQSLTQTGDCIQCWLRGRVRA